VTFLTETATGTWSVSGQMLITTSGTVATTGRTAAAGGGLIEGGSGMPRADDIPATLSHGEYVVQAGAVSKYGPGMLDSINKGHVAEGGYTGSLPGLGGGRAPQYEGVQSTLPRAPEAAVERRWREGRRLRPAVRQVALARWEEARTAADKESARQGIVQLQDAILAKARADLMEVETLLPVIVEQVCSGSVSIRGLDAVP